MRRATCCDPQPQAIPSALGRRVAPGLVPPPALTRNTIEHSPHIGMPITSGGSISNRSGSTRTIRAVNFEQFSDAIRRDQTPADWTRQRASDWPFFGQFPVPIWLVCRSHRRCLQASPGSAQARLLQSRICNSCLEKPVSVARRSAAGDARGLCVSSGPQRSSTRRPASCAAPTRRARNLTVRRT